MFDFRPFHSSTDFEPAYVSPSVLHLPPALLSSPLSLSSLSLHATLLCSSQAHLTTDFIFSNSLVSLRPCQVTLSSSFTGN